MEAVLSHVPGDEGPPFWWQFTHYPSAERLASYWDHFTCSASNPDIVAAGNQETLSHPDSVLFLCCHHNLRDGAVVYLEEQLEKIFNTPAEKIEVMGLSNFLMAEANELCKIEGEGSFYVDGLRNRVRSVLMETLSDVQSWQFLFYNHEAARHGKEVAHYQKPVEVITALDQCTAALILMVLNPNLVVYVSGGRNRPEGAISESDTHLILMQLLLYDPGVVAFLKQFGQTPATINARLQSEPGGFNTPSNIALSMMRAKQRKNCYPQYGGVLTLDMKVERMQEYLQLFGLDGFCCIGIPGPRDEDSRIGEFVAGRGNGNHIWGDPKKLKDRVDASERNWRYIRECMALGPIEAQLIETLLNGGPPNGCFASLPWQAPVPVA